jgi:hypothetical protein
MQPFDYSIDNQTGSEEDYMNAIRVFSQACGLHPLAGFGMFAADWMLFGNESTTLGAGWLISIPVAFALTIACMFIQRYAFRDEWGAAIGKSLLVGLLTGIPTALPSIVALGGGAIGTVKMLLPRLNQQ